MPRTCGVVGDVAGGTTVHIVGRAGGGVDTERTADHGTIAGAEQG
jgi:hypothetical protein